MVEPPLRIIRATRGGRTVKVPKPMLVIDSRQPAPYAWDFERFEKWFSGVERRALKLGDYSIAGYETRITAERKSLDDAIMSVAPSQRRSQFIETMDMGATSWMGIYEPEVINDQ